MGWRILFRTDRTYYGSTCGAGIGVTRPQVASCWQAPHALFAVEGAWLSHVRATEQ